MPAKSQKQAVAARIARGIQKGEVKPKAGSASAEMAKMKPSSLKHFTKTEAATCLECNCNPCNCKSSMLGDMVKEMSGQQGGMTLNGKKIDISSIEIEDIDRRDYPDFVDAFISAASYEDGTPLTDSELDQLTQQEGGWINWYIHDNQLWL